MIDYEPRCWRCARVLAYHVCRPWAIQCSRCRARNGSPPSAAGPSLEQAEWLERAYRMFDELSAAKQRADALK